MPYVQSASVTNFGAAGTSKALATGFSPTAGNLLAVLIAAHNVGGGTATIQTVTDNLGNTYTKRSDSGNWAGARWTAEIWEAHGITDGGVLTVTVTTLASTNLIIIAAEYDTIASNPFDKAANNHGNSVSPDSGNAAITFAAEQLVALIALDSVTIGFTEGAGWTKRDDVTNLDGPMQMALIDQVTTVTANYKATGTLTLAANWSAKITTYSQGSIPLVGTGTGAGTLISTLSLTPGPRGNGRTNAFVRGDRRRREVLQ